MPWDLLIFGLFSYFLGIKIQKYSDKKKSKTSEWSSKYWGECATCYPGVTMKFGADNKHHLSQVMGWHRDDHHTSSEVNFNHRFDPSVILNNPYRGVYHPDTMVLELLKDSKPSLKEWFRVTDFSSTLDFKEPA